MRVSKRLLAVAAVLLGLAACGRESAPPEPSASAATLRSPTARAPYGVIADVSYAGDVAHLAADAKVYLFLREKGARMPLAVQYFAATELPKRASFTTREPLSDVEIVARLSMSGRVERSPGDPEASLRVGTTGHPPETVKLVLAETADAAASLPGASTPASRARPAPVRVRALVTIAATVDLPPDTTVFVIARDAQNPMPLAVKKLSLSDLPAEVVLSDDDAMLFSHRLSGADAFSLVARASPSARAERAPEDLESAAVQVDASSIPPQVTLAIGGTGSPAQAR